MADKNAEYRPARIVCPDCGMSTWDESFGCLLPGCENYAVLDELNRDEVPDGE